MRRILTYLSIIGLLAACSDNEMHDYAAWQATYDDGSLSLSVPREAGYQRATIRVQGAPEGRAVTVVCHDEWLTLYTDTLLLDGRTATHTFMPMSRALSTMKPPINPVAPVL